MNKISIITKFLLSYYPVIMLATLFAQNIPNAKYPTGIIIDLKSPQGNVFYLMGPAIIGLYGNLACRPKKLPNSNSNNPAQQHTTPTLTFYANGLELCLLTVKKHI